MSDAELVANAHWIGSTIAISVGILFVVLFELQNVIRYGFRHNPTVKEILDGMKFEPDTTILNTLNNQEDER